MTRSAETVPAAQYAIQLIGPEELGLNTEKEVYKPGPHHILARVEAVGLCFSDLKLLHQFADHPRKGKIISGISQDVLDELPSYKPGELPTVPGHEAVCRIVAVGDKVRRHSVAERVMVQADWRLARTTESNGAFGYNFEGALQEYVLLDERIVTEQDTGERYLIPVGEDLSASAVALIEPWACVENSYITRERQTIKAGGKMLVAAQAGAKIKGLAECFAPKGKPASITIICDEDDQRQLPDDLDIPVTRACGADELEDESFDDIVYFGAGREDIESLNDKLAAGGIFNIVLAGRKIGEPVSVGVGRVHYGSTRWIGATSANAADAYGVIPRTGEIRSGDRITVVGAGGPMGQMHTIRAVSSGVEGISVAATDLDDERLESLRQKAQPLAERYGVSLRIVNLRGEPLPEKFSYFAIMAPLSRLVAQAISDSAKGALINIFAGIPALTRHGLDMDTYIANGCFMFGTSGSRTTDMKSVLAKVSGGLLDTNSSVDAVSGMAGAADGIRTVKNRLLAGKIIVYPALHEMPLIPLSALAKHFPTVADKLNHGIWTKAAEEELLKVAR